MELINKIADTLYQNLASKFGEVNIADEGAGAVLETEQARLFDFNYVVEGEKYGPVTISVIDPANFTIYFAESLSGDLPDSIQRSWFDFLKEMRMFAKKNMMNFDVRNIGKNQLDKRDYEAITKNSSQYTTDEITMESVSKLFGSTKTSYQTVESARIIVKHRSAVDEDKMGSRSRHIQSVFIENSAKERFKFPFKYLPGARAMARHVHAGGNPHDELGSHIIECVKEMYELRNFVKKLNRADGFVNEDSADIISDAKKRYQGLKATVNTLSKPKGYSNYAENFQPTESIYDESDINELKSKLVRNVDQTELESFLPTVLKARRKVAEDMGPIHDIIQGKSKIVVTPNPEEDALIKKQLAFVKANKFKKPNDSQGLDHTENPLHALVRRILATISVRTKDDDLARAIFNIDDSFANKHDKEMAIAIAGKWLKGDVEVQDFDPKYKMKPQDEAAQFEKWTDSVVKEGTWHLPSSEEHVAKFKEIMATPVIAGEEGQAATDEIEEIFGDDELYDDLAELGSKDPNADARDVINAWLRQVVTRAEGTEHHKYLVKMLGYGDISKELPIETEAAVEEAVEVKVGDVKNHDELGKIKVLKIIQKGDDGEYLIQTNQGNKKVSHDEFMGFVLINKNKKADRSDGTHAQLLPHIKNVKSAMVKHAQEDPSEANEFIEHLDDMMNAGDVEVVDMMQPDYMDTEARDSLISYFMVSISKDPKLFNKLFPGENIEEYKSDYSDMFEGKQMSNPEEVLKKGMADALAKEIEDEIEDEKDDTDESINHLAKLAGVMSSNKALRPKKNEHQTTPRSIHKRK